LLRTYRTGDVEEHHEPSPYGYRADHRRDAKVPLEGRCAITPRDAGELSLEPETQLSPMIDGAPFIRLTFGGESRRELHGGLGVKAVELQTPPSLVVFHRQERAIAKGQLFCLPERADADSRL
jgi:hypothetical protein